MSEFKLTQEDLNSLLWKKLETHLNARLERLRRKNDAHSPIETTAKLRGQIAEVKILLGLNPKVVEEIVGSEP